MSGLSLALLAYINNSQQRFRCRETGEIVVGRYESELGRGLRDKGWRNLPRDNQLLALAEQVGCRRITGLGNGSLTWELLPGYRCVRGKVRKMARYNIAVVSAPFNPTAHSWLTKNGYVCERNVDTWEDVGDAENGPRLTGGPAYDEYTSVEDRLFIDENGHTDFIKRSGRSRSTQRSDQ